MTPRCPPDERFPTFVGLDRELTAGDGVFGADPARIGARAAGEDIDDRRVDLTLGEPIVSGARQEHICADPSMQVIVPDATNDDILCPCGRVATNRRAGSGHLPRRLMASRVPMV